MKRQKTKSIMTSILCDSIFGKRRSKWEVNAVSFTHRLGKTNTYKRHNVLKQALNKGKITKHQFDWIDCVWNKTLSNNTSNWSMSIAESLKKHTKNMENPIIVELRSQGSSKYAKIIISGCIYYDCSSEDKIDYLTLMIYNSTSLFTHSFHKNKKKLNPLNINNPSDRAVLKAIVYGLFTRPRMCSWMKSDIYDGVTIEDSPRCISEDTLRKKIHINKLKLNQQNAIIQQQSLRKKQIRIRREKFKNWASSFICQVSYEKRLESTLSNMQGNHDQSWDELW